MWKDRLGRKLFPRLEPWERRRNINRIILVILGIIVLAGVVAWISYSKNAMDR